MTAGITPRSNSTNRAVINLVACRHNLSVAKNSAPDSKCIVVIKANGYGHGMVEIANALKDADAYAVARIEEAITLRDAGITLPILLLEGFTSASELKLVQKYQLDSVVHTIIQVQLLEKSKADAITVVVKIDSGMHRLGFNPGEIKNIQQQLEKCSCVNKPVKFMTHFSNADDKQDNKTLKQIEIFYQAIENLPES